MISWIINALPWPVVLGFGLAALAFGFVALRAMGLSASMIWKILGAALVALGAATLQQRGRNAGWRAAQAEQVKAHNRIIKAKQKIDEKVDRMSEAEAKKELKKWSKQQRSQHY